MENSIQEKKKTISIDRTFDLPLATMWKAWSEAESMKKWFCPEDYTCPSSTINFRVGGKFLNAMKSPDGKVTWSSGKYTEIVPMKKIAYWDSFTDAEGNIVPASYYGMPGDWDLQVLVTVNFEEVEGKTQMQLTHADLPEEMADDCVKGWNSCLDKLEKNVK